MKKTIFWQKCLIRNWDKKKILVICRSDYKKWEHKIDTEDSFSRDFPWWSVDFGEDAKEAIMREIHQETWMIAHDVMILDLHSRLVAEDRFFVFWLWWCTDFHIPESWILLSNEHISYERVTLDEIKKLRLRETVKHILPHIEKRISTQD